MLRARQHCCNRYGWLHCKQEDYRAAYEQLIRLRDAELAVNHSFSGEPPALQAWTAEQLASLASQPFYRQQMEAHAADLQQQTDSLLRELEQTAARLAQKVSELEAEREHVLSFLTSET